MPRVRIVLPTPWDRQQLAARPDLVPSDCEVVFDAPADVDCAWDFDVLRYIDAAAAAWRGDTAGVFSSSDYPGAAVAAAIATAAGLPASRPEAVLTAAHKGLSRVVQRGCCAEAVPVFAQFAVEQPGVVAQQVGFPCWIKPAKGTFSVLAQRVTTPAELARALAAPFVPEYREQTLHIWRQLVRRYLGAGVDATAFVAERELAGQLVTVEGYCIAEDAQVLGIVDSVVEPRTRSFVAFEYPSALPAAVQTRLGAMACRVARALGLRWTLWNAEMTWDAATGAAGIIEFNPRMCGQFADLYEKVDGVHGHRVAIELALGRVPVRRRGGGAFACAASLPLRVFEPVRVLRAPTANECAAIAAAYDGVLCWSEVATGNRLADFARGEDGHSHRYAVVNLGGRSRADLRARAAEIVARLDYRFESLPRA